MIKKKTALPKRSYQDSINTTHAKTIDTSDDTSDAKLTAATKKAIKKRKLSPKAQEKLNERIRNLIRLSKEQSFLTYKDINQALPDSVNNPDEIENVISYCKTSKLTFSTTTKLKPSRRAKKRLKRKEVHLAKRYFGRSSPDVSQTNGASSSPDS